MLGPVNPLLTYQRSVDKQSQRALRSVKATIVILSEAKNLVYIRAVAYIPRSFAPLRMTTLGAVGEKIDTLRKEENPRRKVR
jgi:hypothetical protein